MRDSSATVYGETKKAEPTPTDMLTKNSDQGTAIGSASNNSPIEYQPQLSLDR